MFEVYNVIKDLPGSTRARELLVKKALHYLDGLTRETDEDPSLQAELATAYQKMGEVQGGPVFNANLGDTAGALESQRKALAIRMALSMHYSTNARFHRDLAISYDRVGELLLVRGDVAAAREHYQKALQLLEGLKVTDPNDIQIQRQLA